MLSSGHGIQFAIVLFTHNLYVYDFCEGRHNRCIRDNETGTSFYDIFEM